MLEPLNTNARATADKYIRFMARLSNVGRTLNVCDGCGSQSKDDADCGTNRSPVQSFDTLGGGPVSENAVSQDLESGSKIVLLITWVTIFLEEPD
jgi:hypothetical protein